MTPYDALDRPVTPDGAPYDEVRVARVSSRSLHFWTALACDVLLVRALPPCLFALITYV